MNTAFLKHLNSGIVWLLLLFSSFMNPLGRRWSRNDSGGGVLFPFMSSVKEEEKRSHDFRLHSLHYELRAEESSHLSRAEMNMKPKRRRSDTTANLRRQKKVVAYSCRPTATAGSCLYSACQAPRTRCERLASPRSEHDTATASVHRRLQSKPAEASH